MNILLIVIYFRMDTKKNTKNLLGEPNPEDVEDYKERMKILVQEDLLRIEKERLAMEAADKAEAERLDSEGCGWNGEPGEDGHGGLWEQDGVPADEGEGGPGDDDLGGGGDGGHDESQGPCIYDRKSGTFRRGDYPCDVDDGDVPEDDGGKDERGPSTVSPGPGADVGTSPGSPGVTFIPPFDRKGGSGVGVGLGVGLGCAGVACGVILVGGVYFYVKRLVIIL